MNSKMLQYCHYQLTEQERGMYSQYSSRLAFLEAELLNEYRIVSKDFRFFLVATSLVRNLSDDDLIAAIDSQQVVLPAPLIDKHVFARNVQACEEKIEMLTARMQQLDREAAFSSSASSAKTKVEEMKMIAMQVGSLEHDKYELSLRIPIDTRQYYSGISEILDEILELSLKRARLFVIRDIV